MRIFKNKSFARFERKAGISDSDLRKAIKDANRGLISADLGGGVIKQRIARKGSGKSGGFRTLILFKVDERPFSFMDSRRTSWITFAQTNWQLSRNWRSRCWPTVKLKWKR